jgi:UrcA family protein
MLNKSAFTTLLIAVTFGMAFAQSVAAEPASSHTISKTVRVSDLDVSSEPGAQALLGRIRRAAIYVCSGGDWRVQLYRANGFRTCVDEASGRAVADLGNPTVTAMYNGSSLRLATK